METRYSKVGPFNNKANGTNRTKTGLTPRELIHYHINNPDEPISDEDMENLVLTIDNNTIAASAPKDIVIGTSDNTMLSVND